MVGYTPFISFERPIQWIPGLKRSGREAEIQFPKLVSRVHSFFIENPATPRNNYVVGYTPFLSFEPLIHRVPGIMRSGREAAVQISLFISRVHSFFIETRPTSCNKFVCGVHFILIIRASYPYSTRGNAVGAWSWDTKSLIDNVEVLHFL
jgi:hypothetical protein